MTARPNARELAASVREFLETEVLPAFDDRRMRFRTRVAMNALSIVERESPPPAPADPGEIELARRIRAGDVRDGDLEALRQNVRSLLLIASPAYLERYDDDPK
ncbi:hypothetical protein BH20ACT13_BH20ACT13_14580 [soil metagenome]